MLLNVLVRGDGICVGGEGKLDAMSASSEGAADKRVLVLTDVGRGLSSSSLVFTVNFWPLPGTSAV